MATGFICEPEEDCGLNMKTQCSLYADATLALQVVSVVQHCFNIKNEGSVVCQNKK
jgi:hypothetical protein